jgi:hypothetical protein
MYGTVVLFAMWTNAVVPFKALSRSALPLPPSVIGTWHGESICKGDHPACKNEEVVYRFELVAGKLGVVTLLADKIIDGKREPMYKLEFQYDDAKGTLVCEFTRRQTHGLWEYKITGDKMEGTLMLLPDKTLGRQVKVNRVSEDQVPAAPAREAYE